MAPIDATEGFLGCLKAENTTHLLDVLAPVDHLTEQELNRLDSEGRIVMTDHRLFVLLNVYFPAGMSDDERMDFKMNFNHAVECRVRDLINQGREVVVVGDVSCFSITIFQSLWVESLQALL